MIVDPYKRPHTRKLIAFVTPEGEYVDEAGEVLNPKRIKRNMRCFCAWETARVLTINGMGESLMWNGEHIRWRPFQHPDELDWYQRPSDAYVLRVPMYERPEPNVSELARWRDWLWTYRAIPSTMGGTSMSLLKARLRRRLWCSVGWDTKDLRQSAGGIIRMGVHGPGEFRGELVHFDMPAAYATELGSLRYGGHWWVEENFSDAWLDHLTKRGVPVLVRARVYVPKKFGKGNGPLPIRPAAPLNPIKSRALEALGKRYPVGKHVQGVWTWEEVKAAKVSGCSVKIIEAWHHASPKQSPFASWWAAIQTGREMEGLAGTLAKVTGNALWGMFALDPESRGRRSIHYKPKTKRKVQVRKLEFGSTRIPAIDLAEIVAGRVRARLWEAMQMCGDDLICAHTDGLWTYDRVKLVGEWRAKEHARELQVLTPQHMRWTKPGARPQTMYSGVPYQQAEEKFDKDWSEYEAEKASAAA